MRPQQTDWPRIAALYAALAVAQPPPVVALNRAVAIGMAQGPAAALTLVEELAADERLRGDHWLPSVHGDLLARPGRHAQAQAQLERAAALAQNKCERQLLLQRAAASAALTN